MASVDLAVTGAHSLPERHKEMEVDQRKRSKQKAERALLGWHACQELERSSKLSYLQERVRLQRDLIAKSDLLTEVLRDKHDLQRRKDNESKKKWRHEQIEATRAKQKRIQKHQQMMRETLEMKEKEEGEEGEVLYMVPVEEREDEGSGGQQELVVLPSGVDAVSSFSSSSTSPSQSNSGSGPRTTNPKLNQLVKACKGNMAIDTMWNKLKHENRRRASHLEQKCLRLRDGEMSPFLKQCMATFDLPYTRQSKFSWDDIRCMQQTEREAQRRHSFPPIGEQLPPANTSEGRRLVNLMFYAALENEHNASEMLLRKQFRHSIAEGSVSSLIPEDTLKPIGALLMQLREKERVRLESRGSAKHPAKARLTAQASTEEEEEEEEKEEEAVVDRSSRRSSIFVASNEATTSAKVGEAGQTHLPVITEEPVGAILPLPSPEEGRVRTWSSQSVRRRGTVLSTRKKLKDVREPQQRDQLWEPLDMDALTENKQLRICEARSSSLGLRGYSHGAPKLWKVPV